MSRSKPLALSEWYAVRNARTRFVYPSTLSCTRRDARAAFMLLWNKRVLWRHFRDGAGGQDRHEVVQVRIEVIGDD